MGSESLMRSRCGAGQQTASRSGCSKTNGSPSANIALTMITAHEAHRVERLLLNVGDSEREGDAVVQAEEEAGEKY